MKFLNRSDPDFAQRWNLPGNTVQEAAELRAVGIDDKVQNEQSTGGPSKDDAEKAEAVAKDAGDSGTQIDTL